MRVQFPYIFSILLFCGFWTGAFAQQSKIDSLLHLLKEDTEDSSKVTHLTLISASFIDLGSYDTALHYTKNAMQLARKINFKKGIATSFSCLGVCYSFKGDYPNALDNYLKALKIDEEIHDKSGKAKHLGNIGTIFTYQGNYAKALDYFFRALKVAEELGDKNQIETWYGNIGNAYWYQTDTPQLLFAERDSLLSLALVYYTKALDLAEQLGNKIHMAIWTDNSGIIYKDMAQASSPDNKILRMRLYNRALNCFLISLKLEEELGSNSGIANTLSNMGELYFITGKYNEAEMAFMKAITINESIGALYEIKQLEESLSQLYETTGRYPKALEHYKKAMALKDTLFNEEKHNEITRKEMTYEFEKKEAAAKAEQEKEQAVAEAEKKKQQVILYSAISGLLVVLAFAGFIFRSLNITRKQKQLIEIQKTEVDKQKELADSRRIIAEEQKHIIEQQKKIVEEHNKEITDSINYAQRIQRALLASNNILNKNLGEHFVLFKPKDIVSGDFYWASEKDGRFYLAVCDSTGHGVPGAFMSLLNISFLNEAISEKEIKEPNNVLNHSRQRLIENLSSEGAQDGMDGILVCFDRSKNEISYSAAHNEPLLMNGELQHLDSDSMPVGLGDKKDSFTNHIISYQSGNILYLYTDGYADQFGGPKGKKFKYKQLNDLLSANSSKPLSEQKNILDNIFEDWRGNLEQVDDVLVIGIRL